MHRRPDGHLRARVGVSSTPYPAGSWGFSEEPKAESPCCWQNVESYGEVSEGKGASGFRKVLCSGCYGADVKVLGGWSSHLRALGKNGIGSRTRYWQRPQLEVTVSS